MTSTMTQTTAPAAAASITLKQQPFSLMRNFQPPAGARRVVSEAELSLNCGIGSETGRAWVAVHGHVFDITNFSLVHPGGSSIRLAAGRDATCLLESYHPLHSIAHVSAVLSSNKVAYIGTLQTKDAKGLLSAYVRPDERFFQDVRARVHDYIASTGDRSYRATYRWLGEVEALVTLMVYMYACVQVGVYGSWAWTVALGFLTGRMGFLMHMGNHCAVSPSPRINEWVGHFMDIAGSNHTIWGYEHQVAHHCDPNELHKDNDCEIGNPLVRMHPLIPHHVWQQYQHLTVPFGMTFGFFKWIIGDVGHFWSKQVGNISMAIDARDWRGMVFFKSIWVIVHVLVPLYFCGWRLALAQLVVFMGVGGHYLENIFIVNHIQNGLVPPTGAHWASKQILATSNWCSGSVWANWASGGLNHQIEHHLFPALSYYWYPHIAPIVERTAREHGLPYANYTSFPAAWLDMFRYLRDMGSPEFVDTKGNKGAPALPEEAAKAAAKKTH